MVANELYLKLKSKNKKKGGFFCFWISESKIKIFFRVKLKKTKATAN